MLVFGDISVDVLARLERELRLGDDNLLPALEQHLGGVGANAAIALARWGLSVRLLGCVGRDWFGEFALRCLTNERIDISYVQQTDRAMTGYFFMPISPDGQRTIIGSRGATAEIKAFDERWACLDGVEALFLVGYDFLSPASRVVAEGLLQEACKRGVRVALDVGVAPSQQIPKVILEVLPKVNVLFISLGEAMALTGKSGNEEVLAALGKSGAREMVVKLGAGGCLIGETNAWCTVPPFPVSAKDTTGAGDAFAAAYLRARLRGWPAKDAALLANAAGAAAAAVVGAGENTPGPDAVMRVLADGILSGEMEKIRQRVVQKLQQEFQPVQSAGV
ncbi:MAG TPA: carbohydrate kinase family protein [Candidatus Acidoferrales bacterium]|nr:carbohydrate kinase family protein [Candidatus Acidoferrales bacterium]